MGFISLILQVVYTGLYIIKVVLRCNNIALLGCNNMALLEYNKTIKNNKKDKNRIFRS